LPDEVEWLHSDCKLSSVVVSSFDYERKSFRASTICFEIKSILLEVLVIPFVLFLHDALVEATARFNGRRKSVRRVANLIEAHDAPQSFIPRLVVAAGT